MNLVRFAKQIKKRDKISAFSYFLAEVLEVIFFKTYADGRQEIQEKLLIPVSGEKDTAAARPRIAGQYHGPWIHIVMRQGGFVKTFAVPEVTEEQLNAALLRRVSEEMPHLANDILYHIAIQNAGMSPRPEALLYGISKAALEDQLSKLECLGIVPDSVMLSTEVLFDYYQRTQAPADNAMLIHEAGRQLELIYVSQGRLIQSRWFKKDAYEQEGLETLLKTANDSLQREGRSLPSKAVVMGGDFKGTASLGAIPHEFLKSENESAENNHILWSAAQRAYENRSVFDFTPSAWELRRQKNKLAGERSSLFTWVVIFSAALFFLSLCGLLAAGLEGAFLAVKHAPIAASVKELKTLQTKALSAKTYQQRKLYPVLLLEKLRGAVPAGVLLEKLDYDQGTSLFVMRGESTAEPSIHDFLGELQKQVLFSDLTLERVEARQEEGGRIYEFEIKGFLGRRGAA